MLMERPGPSRHEMSEPSEARRPRDNGAAAEHPAASKGLRHWLRRLFRGRNGAESLHDSIEELIEQGESGDRDDGDEIVLVRNILRLRDLTAHDIMVPRADIVAVDIETRLAELVERMSGAAHSRMPVYRDTLDDALGMVHIKDVVAWRDTDRPFKISTILRRILFVAPSMPILELLLQMRVSRTHMALVVDEFGGTDGLITIEDLVEEIVGEIQDEHDAENAPTMIDTPDGSIEADARVEIEDFETKVGALLTPEEQEADIETLGGLVFSLAGRVPSRGEVIRHPSGAEFEVLDADPRRIKRLRVCRPPTPGS